MDKQTKEVIDSVKDSHVFVPYEEAVKERSVKQKEDVKQEQEKEENKFVSVTEIKDGYLEDEFDPSDLVNSIFGNPKDKIKDFEEKEDCDFSEDDEESEGAEETEKEEKQKEREDLRTLKIEGNSCDSHMLNILRQMCIEMEAVEKSKEPFDFSNSVPPNFLTVRDWNEVLEEEADFELNFNGKKETLKKGDSPYREDLRNLFNEAVSLFYYYKNSKNYFKKENKWFEIVSPHPQPLGTNAGKLVEKIRQVMPKKRDRKFGFVPDKEKLYSKENIEACNKRHAALNEVEKKQVDDLVSSFVSEISQNLGKFPDEDSFLKYLEGERIVRDIQSKIDLDVDEDKVDMIMYYVIVKNFLSQHFFNKSIDAVIEEVKRKSVTKENKVINSIKDVLNSDMSEEAKLRIIDSLVSK